MSALLPNLKFTLSALESPGVECDERAGDHHFRKRNVQCGRIQHHLRHNAWRPTASIVFVGYQGVGTPGRKIVDGASSIRLFNEDVAIKAKVFTIGGFSAHAGRARFWIGSGKWRIPVCKSCWCMAKRKHSRSFPALSRPVPSFSVCSRLFGRNGSCGGSYSRSGRYRPTKSYAHVDWDLLLEETEGKLSKLRTRLEKAGERPGMNRLISGIVSLSSTRNCCPS